MALVLLLVCLAITACGSTKQEPLEIIEDNYRNYYEIFVYSFYDSDGDGIGDLKGVEQKLDYIADMGFNGIWLMPIMPSPSYHKYDVIDYKDVDPQYGTLEDFKNLADACHQKGIRLIIDFVINHSSSQNKWFTEACAYMKSLAPGQEPAPADCPYVDYYHFDRKAKNNSWYQIPGTDWYYEGVFWDQMPDLNLACEELKNELKDIASFWMEQGIDGFRMDAALHFEENQPDFNTETLNWLYNYCKESNPDFYMVSEIWDSAQTIGSYYQSETPSMFDFPLSGVDGHLFKAACRRGDATALVKAMARIQEVYGENYADYIDAPFLTNHDQARIANGLMVEEDAIKMAGGLLLMMNGSPFVYYGEEIGMQSKGMEDENKRLPMYWNADKAAKGMCVGPENSDKSFQQSLPSVEEQLKNKDSILNYYKRALLLRNQIPEIARGTVSIVDSLCNGHQAAITKDWNGSIIGIVYNTGEEDITVDVNNTELINGQLKGYLTLHPDQKITYKEGILTMPARSIAILK